MVTQELAAAGPDGLGRAIPTSARADDGVRLRSIDAFRGAVLAFMVLTPASGDPTDFPLLRHAAWNGVTASDLVLPTFLVTSGLSLSFLLRPPVTRAKTQRLVRRVLVLLALGLVYNAYGASGSDLGTLRYTGVLQMIAISGFLAALVVLATRRQGADRPLLIGGVAVALPALYGFGVRAMADRCPSSIPCSPYMDWDVGLLGAAHTYGSGAPGYDPEGVAVSITATALVLVGYLVGRRLHHATSTRLPQLAATTAAVGSALLAAAWLLDRIDPVNKRLFTPAFVALAAGVALMGTALFVAVLDGGRQPDRRPRWRHAVFPLVALGRNALVVYLLERFLLQTATMVEVGDRKLRGVVLDALPGTATTAHLFYTAALLAVVATVTAWLHWRQRYVAL